MPDGASAAAPPTKFPIVDVRLTPDDRSEALRRDVLRGLTSTPKWLAPKWFYDERGSALFGEITQLPEYYLTRRERAILAVRAPAIARLAKADVLAEIGAGTSEKTRLVLDALVVRGLRRFVALDVSERTLRTSATRIAAAYPGVEVHAVVGDLERHLDAIPTGGRRLVAFLGSSIGNLGPRERARFLSALSALAEDGDTLLLGVDLVKDPARLEAAYGDAAGITAAFNRNILLVVNRELDADFDAESFDHVARWNAEGEWVEMRLRSRRRQAVSVRALELEVSFQAGEDVLTEISAKFRRERIESELRQAGFEPAAWWTDPAGDFGVSLSVAAGA